MAKPKTARKKSRTENSENLLKLLEPQEAEEKLRQALAASPADNQAAYELGILLATLGREREAVPFLRQASEHIGEPQRTIVRDLLVKCSRKGALEAMLHLREVFQDVARELQQPHPRVPPPPPTSPRSIVPESPEFIETIEKIDFVQSIDADEPVIEISCADDGPARLDFSVVPGAIKSNPLADHGDPILTFRIDSAGTERSRPAFQHAVRLEPYSNQPPVYLPLRKGANRIHVSGAAVQIIEARTPDSSPARPPNQLIVPITSYCNFQCVMCPHGLPEGVKDKAHYPDAIADLLIAELNGYSQSCDVALTGLGESFMSPGFVRFVEAVKNPLVKFNFTTNGSMLTPSHIAWMLSSKIWRVNVSLDAGTPETFFKIRRSEWSRIVRNLEALAEAAATSGRKDFLLELNMTLMRENIDEIEPFLRLASRLNASAYLAHLNDYDCNDAWVVEHNGFVFDYQRQILRSGPEVREKISRARALAQELRVPFNMETAMRPLLEIGPTGERVETDPQMLGTSTPPISHCPAPWATDAEAAAVVHADGAVSMCCLQSPIGNIQTDGGLMGVWQGPTARAVRQRMLAGTIPQPCASANCSFVAAQRAWSRESYPVRIANQSTG
jgi:molybdenum cofactor biosynthesis enzyme MoaA